MQSNDSPHNPSKVLEHPVEKVTIFTPFKEQAPHYYIVPFAAGAPSLRKQIGQPLMMIYSSSTDDPLMRGFTILRWRTIKPGIAWLFFDIPYDCCSSVGTLPYLWLLGQSKTNKKKSMFSNLCPNNACCVNNNNQKIVNSGNRSSDPASALF